MASKKTKDKITTRIVKKVFGGIIQQEVSKRFTAAVNREQEDRDWRRITGKTRKRDLSPIKQDKMIRVMDFLMDRNPQAKEIIELSTDFILGDGLKYKVEDKKASKLVDEFWKINLFDLKQFDRVSELSRYGEQAYNTFINEFSGLVKIGAFDPEQIDKVLSNPNNAEELEWIVGKNTGESKPPKWEIIREVEVKDNAGKKTGEMKLEGKAFFFSVNRTSHGTRGKADLLPIADWLDKYDKSLYTMTERVNFLLAFLWDITIQGGDEVQMRQRLQDLLLNKPRAGSFNIHNDQETWQALSPELKSGDFTEFFRLIQSHLSSGSGLPKHWLFKTSEDINKASSKEISEPTYRKLKRRQTYIKYMFEQMFKFQIQQGIDVGILKKKSVEDYPFTIILPDPSRKEAVEIAKTMTDITPSLISSMTNNLLSEDTVRKIMVMMVNQLGVDTKLEDEENKIQEQKEKVNDSFADAANNLSNVLKDKDNPEDKDNPKKEKEDDNNKKK